MRSPSKPDSSTSCSRAPPRPCSSSASGCSTSPPAASCGRTCSPASPRGPPRAQAAAYYLVAYVATTLLVFAALVALSPVGGEIALLEDCRGLFWRRPVLAGLFATSLLSLAGMPLTAGFAGKLYLVRAAI